MVYKDSDELKKIPERFAGSGWDLIEAPAKLYLEGSGDKEKLVSAIRQADQECGSCGCEYDAMYKRALELLQG